MCLGAIHVLEEAWEEHGARLGRLEDGGVVSLAFVPEAEPGAYVLVHMGVPVEVLERARARSLRCNFAKGEGREQEIGRHRARVRDRVSSAASRSG